MPAASSGSSTAGWTRTGGRSSGPHPGGSMKVPFLFFLIFLLTLLPPPCGAPASDGTDGDVLSLPMEWGGHLKIRGSLSRPPGGSLYDASGGGTLLDGQAGLRLKNDLFPAEGVRLTTHYELILAGGDSWRRAQPWKGTLEFPGIVEDDRRFFDFTATLEEGQSGVLYHRLDRLVLSVSRPWGTVRAGRDAVTWGNGLLFNPMDLVNPFAPSDIDREYKIGDDLVSFQRNLGGKGDVQTFFVPRRDPLTGSLRWDRSTLAGKLHLGRGTTEWDLLLAKNGGDRVIGMGSAGYLGGAAWRFDATWTVPRGGDPDGGYLSVVANIDRSGVFFGKNVYGFLECFWNGLGKDDYAEALEDPRILERLERGDLFTLGKRYLAGHIQVELHPLWNVYVTAVNNLRDPSGLIEPRVVWDAATSLRFTLGAILPWGRTGSEYGGFPAGSGLYVYGPEEQVFLWGTYYF